MLYSLFRALRPQDWVKNLFLFAALIFAGMLFHVELLMRVTYALILFCLASSSIYLFNDIVDLQHDRQHPLKSQRPVASGKLSVAIARNSAVVLVLLALVDGYYLEKSFGYVLALYIGLNIFYTLLLRQFVILDVMAIAFGYVLRVLAGAAVVNLPVSEWLLICTLLLSLFLGFGKRRHELTLLESTANDHRAVLAHYSPYFLDQMIIIVTASTVMSYVLYTVSEETVQKFGTKHLLFTVPFVLYGIFRYLYLVHKREEGGNPTKTLFTDVPLLVSVFLWIGLSVFIIYYHVL